MTGGIRGHFGERSIVLSSWARHFHGASISPPSSRSHARLATLISALNKVGNPFKKESLRFKISFILQQAFTCN